MTSYNYAYYKKAIAESINFAATSLGFGKGQAIPFAYEDNMLRLEENPIEVTYLEVSIAYEYLLIDVLKEFSDDDFITLDILHHLQPAQLDAAINPLSDDERALFMHDANALIAYYRGRNLI